MSFEARTAWNGRFDQIFLSRTTPWKGPSTSGPFFIAPVSLAKDPHMVSEFHGVVNKIPLQRLAE